MRVPEKTAINTEPVHIIKFGFFIRRIKTINIDLKYDHKYRSYVECVYV